MTNEEAIKNIGIAENMLIDCFKLNNSKEDNAILLALAKAQESLLKQIPKKVIAHIERFGTWFSCPNCGRWVTSWEETHTGTKVYKYDCSYCDQCGQALDWSEVDD